MKIELPCEIIRDLLPNYIDGLASERTVETVEAHLQQCAACHNVYKSMKEEDDKQWDNGLNSQETEKALFKKINHKVNKKVRMAIIAGVIGIILVVGLTHLLFNVPLKKIPIHDVAVSASVYPIESLVTGENQDLSDNSVIISKDGVHNDEISYSIRIPDMLNGQMAVTQSMLDGDGYLSYISWESSYLLKDIEWDIQTVGNKSVMYVTEFKTTLLNNKGTSNAYIMPMIEFQKIDQIVYVQADGKEKVLWENGDK